MKKIIFINRYFYPDHSATSQMLSDLVFGIIDKIDGKEIHIVTSRQRYDDANANLPKYEIINNIYIHRVWSFNFGRQNLAGRAIDYASFYVLSSFKLLRLVQKDDLLIAKTDPPLISVVAGLIAKLKKANLINWLQDLFPEVAAELGIKLAQGLPYKLLKLMRNNALKQAKVNVVIGEKMAEKVLDEGVDKKKIKVIHNWANGEQIKPVSHEQNPLRKQWGLDSKFVIGYSGNLGRSHDFLTILGAAEALKNEKNVIFLFIGGGAQTLVVQQICQDKKLENIFFKPYQPREKLAESLSVADLHLITLKPELEGLIVPSKFYGTIAAGRPVVFLGSETGEITRLINLGEIGFSINQNDSLKLETIIRNFSNDLPSLEQYSKKARNLYDTKFSIDKSINAWFSVIQGVNSKRENESL